MKTNKIALVCAAALTLTACAAAEEKVIPDMPAEELYLNGYDAYTAKDYDEAAEFFDQVERQHPYSVWSARAQIMAAYTYYRQNKYDEAILALDRFIQLHPGNQNTPYAYYLKGLCYFEQISDVAREQKMTEESLNTFKELLARYPNSIYTKDVIIKLAEIESHLAGKELSIGRYYLKQKEYVPALNRFQNVITNFPLTDQIPEAYYRLAVGYLSLGMTRQAIQMEALVRQKYPQNEWTQKTTKLVEKYVKG